MLALPGPFIYVQILSLLNHIADHDLMSWSIRGTSKGCITMYHAGRPSA